MKKIIAFLVILALVLMVTGCGGVSDLPADDTAPNENTENPETNDISADLIDENEQIDIGDVI